MGIPKAKKTMQTQTAARFAVVGINQDADFCECCGKSGINSVVWIRDNQTGLVKHFGQVCAAKPAKGFDCQAEIKKSVSAFKAAQTDAQALAFRMYRQRGGTYAEVPGGIKPTDPALVDQCKAEAWATIKAARNL